MTARLSQRSSEEGFTLVEVLIAAVLMIIVLGATLTALTSFQKNTATNQRQNDAQDQARSTLDLMARDLRNLASPVLERPEAIDRNLPQDLIVQSEGRGTGGSLNARNTMRVRFCLAPDRKLYRMTQTWTTAAIPNAPAATVLSRHRLDHLNRRGGERCERHAADLHLQRRRAPGHHRGERDAVRRREPRDAACRDAARDLGVPAEPEPCTRRRSSPSRL